MERHQGIEPCNPLWKSGMWPSTSMARSYSELHSGDETKEPRSDLGAIPTTGVFSLKHVTLCGASR